MNCKWYKGELFINIKLQIEIDSDPVYVYNIDVKLLKKTTLCYSYHWFSQKHIVFLINVLFYECKNS